MVRAGGVLLQPVDLALQGAHADSALRIETMMRSGAAGLTKKSLGAGLHGLDDGVDAARGGEHDHRLVEAARAHLLQGVLAATCRA